MKSRIGAYIKRQPTLAINGSGSNTRHVEFGMEFRTIKQLKVGAVLGPTSIVKPATTVAKNIMDEGAPMNYSFIPEQVYLRLERGTLHSTQHAGDGY